jgi:TolB-like protein/Tfp pilus assembly protein PilF
MGDVLARLKQRKLVQWALAYVAAAFALLQGIDIVAQRFGWPDVVERSLIIAICVGFFMVLLLAWYHGERGAQKVSGIELLILALLLGIGGGALWRFADAPTAATAVAAEPAGTPAGIQPVPAASIPQKSVAVLPWANESGDKDQQYFSDGLSEDFINALSQFAGLKVIGRNSAFQFRNTKDDAQTIGAKLGVAHLLEGSVRREGDIVRISAELINTRDASTLWSQHYDRPYKDLFKLQDDITQAVTSALQAKLLESGGAVVQSDRPPSGNLAAYTAYLQGKFHFARNTESDYRQAIAQYQVAVKDDPRYALAWARLARTAANLATQFLGGQPAQQAYAKARAAANTALTLDPDLAAAHEARGYILLSADFDWTGSQAEYQRAIHLAPNDGPSLFGMGQLVATLGHPDQAVALTRRALATDPLNAAWYHWLAHYLSGLDRLDEAAAASHKAIELQPAATSYHEWLTVIEVLRGNAKAALAAAQAEPASDGWQGVALALARQIGPDHAAANAALKYLIDTRASDASFQIAEVYALRGDPDQMFAWLDRAWANRDAGVANLLFDPFILRYQHDPRFVAFCRKVGLPTTTNAKAMP